MRIRIRLLTKQNFIRHLIALLLVAVVVCVALRKEEKDQQYDIVVLGDSVVGNVGAKQLSFTTYLGEGLGKTAFKGGLGGTTMSFGTEHMWSSVSSEEWCMVKLAEAICYNDWKSQKATMAYANSFMDINKQAVFYFEHTMDTLSRIDFSKVEILIIEHGTNDYNCGKPVDNPDDLYDKTTFGGALRYSLQLLQKSYPNLRIVLMAPLYCELGPEGERKCYNTKYGDGGYLEDYIEVEKQIAEDFGVEWIDAYHYSGIWENNIEEYLPDRLHLNEEGHKIVGDFLTEYFLSH